MYLLLIWRTLNTSTLVAKAREVCSCKTNVELLKFKKWLYFSCLHLKEKKREKNNTPKYELFRNKNYCMVQFYSLFSVQIACFLTI